MKTKREKVMDAMRIGDWVEACRIAREFRRDFIKEDAKTVCRAFEMTWNATFYEQLGYKAEVEMEKAKDILVATYGGSL